MKEAHDERYRYASTKYTNRKQYTQAKHMTIDTKHRSTNGNINNGGACKRERVGVEREGTGSDRAGETGWGGVGAG